MTEKAVIYLPELNECWGAQCIDHCRRRGYDWFIVVGDVNKVGEVLDRREVRIVVVARQEHFMPDWMPRIEVVGDETRRITREVADAARVIRPAYPATEPVSPSEPGRHRRRPKLIR